MNTRLETSLSYSTPHAEPITKSMALELLVALQTASYLLLASYHCNTSNGAPEESSAKGDIKLATLSGASFMVVATFLLDHQLYVNENGSLVDQLPQGPSFQHRDELRSH